jgi:hypothetical protein
MAALSSCVTHNEGSTTYVVDVFVDANPSGAANRVVRVGDLDLSPFKIINNQASTFGFVCTSSREHFLEASIPVSVIDATEVVSTSVLRVVACAYGASGPREQAQLFLEDDGRLLTDPTAGDPRVWAICSSIPGGDCPAGHAF